MKNLKRGRDMQNEVPSELFFHLLFSAPMSTGRIREKRGGIFLTNLNTIISYTYYPIKSSRKVFTKWIYIC